jgi:hypothetical protein
MKILDIPQSGKRGLTVSLETRNGLASRALVIPSNPQSDAQLRVRAFLASVTSKWGGELTQAERDAWTAEAVQHNSRARMGQSGPLTGLQLFAKINCALLVIGGDVITTPPAKAVFDPLPVTGLVITNTADVIALKLTAATAPPDGTMLWGAKPCSAGISKSPGVVLLGTLGSPSSGAIDITSAYTGRYGSPAVGKKVFVKVVQNINGWEDVPRAFSAIVPAAS